jgi:glycosyltransferase involved in cell wall biosynthesis
MTARTVLGMTLYNSAGHLREATDSILRQTHGDFALLMLDDGSSDEAEAIAREYERRDGRVRYWKHAERNGMVPTWKEVVEIARREHPEAEYFAWVSDHDRWDSRWLARMVAELDSHPSAVLAYPQTLRIDEHGQPMGKEPRVFDTSGIADRQGRWGHFSWNGFGSGDMVYGLMRLHALEAAGIFRPVLNPDRLLIAELTLQGQIRQVAEPLWSRRQSNQASVARQSVSLFAGATPPRFGWPPSLQHAIVLQRAGVSATMIATYVVASAWRATRKTETSKSIGRGVDNAHFVKKVIKKAVHHSIYYTLVGARAFAGRCRRIGRKIVYEILMFTHRTGLRGTSKTR